MIYRKILITTGDSDGVGLEVAAKGLTQVGPQSGVIFFLYRSMDADNKKNRLIFQSLDKKFERIVVDDTKQAFEFYDLMKAAKDLSKNVLIDIASELSPAHWVELAATACFNREASAMVTGPISKTCIREAGLKDIGHTDILKRVSGATSVHMGFIGKYFNVVLATAHIPLAQVSARLNFKSLSDALLNANAMRKSLPATLRKKPIGVLGLNPHAGEDGILGHEEASIFPNLRQFALENKIPLQAPLVPDAAFLEKSWPKYSVYLCLYHDQGLIPFKTIHGQDSGVHITLGIPFIRTSVDHGTAKDIYGKNKANHHSMTEALEWALKLSKS